MGLRHVARKLTIHREISEKYESFRDVVLALAQLDCLFSLATVANQPNYVKPTFSKEAKIKVKEGRHPMVEKLLGTLYVPNDIDFDASKKKKTVSMIDICIIDCRSIGKPV